MPRKISTGVTGGPVLGVLKTLDNTISPNIVNQDITIEPSGTGETNIIGNLDITSGSSIKFSDADDSNWVALTSPTTVSSNVTFSLPPADGTNGQVIKTNGSGALEFTDAGLAVTDDSATNSSFYVAFIDQTSGSETGLTISSSKLTFNPSSGTLAATAFDGTNSTLSGTLQAATITETSSIAYKENVRPIENALDAVLKLSGVIYDRKDNSRKDEAGLIAEEVAPVIPNVVTYKDGKPEGINYTKLSAYLIEAIKTLHDDFKNSVNIGQEK